ncbi:MAG: hypothetical protein JKX95_04055 [Bacteroidia bacterium]|nr:hypothetical protein [Bacteroidia bacterium]
MFHVCEAQDIYDLTRSKEYANYLMKTKQYDLAIEEWERVIFLEPDNNIAKKSLIRAYSETDDHDKGIKRIARLYNSTSQIPNNVGMEYVRLLLLHNDLEEIEQAKTQIPSLDNDQKEYIDLNILLLKSDWDNAKELYDALPNKENHLFDGYQKIIEAGINIKHKSPALALLFSSIIPGTGKFYTGYYFDGLLSMLMTGFTGFLAYKGFIVRKEKSVYGWFYAGLAAGFYGGNIVGSVKSVKKYNQLENQKILEKVHRLIKSASF